MVIHAFGDEHTLGWKYCDSAVFSKYKQWLDTNILRLNRDEKSYTPLNNSVWIEKLCNKLKCSFKLYAKKGNTNLDIFNSVISNIDSISEGDSIIINWSDNFRFNLYTDTKINSISELFDYTKHTDNISSSTMGDILKSRTSLKSPYEVHSYEKAIKIICDYKGIDVFFWSIDNLIHLTYEPNVLEKDEYILGKLINKYRGEQGITPKEEYFNELETPLFYSAINYVDGSMFSMAHDTGQEVNSNTHLGERGHDVLSHHFFGYLVKKIKNKTITKNLLI
tara:strand:+ start:640 stop:1476 length:837 start_codon:yes stop_codon:yes gene_type:complete